MLLFTKVGGTYSKSAKRDATAFTQDFTNPLSTYIINTMYIEFRLPSGSGGMAAGYTKMAINKALTQTCTQHNITIAEQVTRPYRFRVSFQHPQDYTLFALVWQIKHLYFKYTVWNEPIDSEYDPKRYTQPLSTP
jgi:hypothetical protein